MVAQSLERSAFWQPALMSLEPLVNKVEGILTSIEGLEVSDMAATAPCL